VELSGPGIVGHHVTARLAALALLQLLACGPTERRSLTPEEEAIVAARAKPVDELQSLQAFAHLHGYVRFFHPTDAAAEADWGALAARGAAVVRDASTLGELTDRLETIFQPVAPTLQLWVTGEADPPLPPAPRPRDALVYWQYEGFPGTPVSLYRPPYNRVRVGATQRERRRFVEAPMHDARLEVEPIADLRVRLPMVLRSEQARDASSDPRSPMDDSVDLDEAARSPHGHTSIDVRQGAVIEVWNVLRNFYPYREVVASDWDAILHDALVDAADATSREDTDRALRRMVHAMRDGHGDVGDKAGRLPSWLPFRLELVEGQAVITATADAERFSVGDVVERIGDVPVLERIRELEGLVSGSEQWRRFRAATWEIPRGPTGERVAVTRRRGDESETVWTRYEPFDPPRPSRPEAVAVFDDVVYVDLTRVKWEELEPRIPEIAEAPGVVFDLRGYPEHIDRIIDHLLPEAEDALWMHVPRIIEPGGEPVAWRHIGWHRRPREPAITGRVAFLISAEAISYAESILKYVEAHGLGRLVGERTAGTNGDIVRIDTLAGFYVVFTGMRVTRHDGTPFHLEGVAPDIPVQPTIAGIRAGRDEVLEAGLAVVREEDESPEETEPTSRAGP
jgi:C-terminal processing protease CtpA/Prc